MKRILITGDSAESKRRAYWSDYHKIHHDRDVENRKKREARRTEEEKESIKKRKKEYYKNRLAENPEAQKTIRKRWYEKNREKILALKKTPESRESCREVVKRYRWKLKLDVLSLYGGRCVCCGETHPEFLAMDHINGGGTKELKKLGMHSGASWYKHLKDNKPSHVRVLCHNCNLSLGLFGRCPHQVERTSP